MNQAAAHFIKLAADQGIAQAQFNYGCCLNQGEGVSIDFRAAAHYFKLAADQGIAEAQFNYGACLILDPIQQDYIVAAEYLRLAADQGHIPDRDTLARLVPLKSQIFRDIFQEAHFYELASNSVPICSTFYGWLLQTGKGVPIDFTVAAEFLRRSADCDEPNGVSSFGACLEQGQGVDVDVLMAVRYYKTAASHQNRCGLNNLGRCLEYGKGIPQNRIRAANYYRLAAEQNLPEAENNFGICLERGIGIKSNIVLAAEYYERSANHGHPDGANNFGFCLEHGRGVKQDILNAAKYYKIASDGGHSEADLNYRRCLRLLGRWDVPDRSSDVSVQQSFDPTPPNNTHFKSSKIPVNELDHLRSSALESEVDICEGSSAFVTFTHDRITNDKHAVKTSRHYGMDSIFEREVAILKSLNHPLVVQFQGYVPSSGKQKSAIVMEFVPNGSLADHLPSTKGTDLCELRGDSRIAIIIVGIVLAMRYIHSQDIIHRDLKPSNILLNWDWTVRIADFGHSVRIEESDTADQSVPIYFWYVPPEGYEGQWSLTSDVFSFGLILYELITGCPVFAKNLTRRQIMLKFQEDKWFPDIPAFVHPAVRQLIEECLAMNPEERPSFADIFKYLKKKIRFRILPKVQPVKVFKFLSDIKAKEA
jgi:TPR repeat protein